MRFVLLVLLMGCASRPPTGDSVRPLSPLQVDASGMIFPYGRYRHVIHIRVNKGEDGQPMRLSFTGVIASSPESIEVVGLSPFNTTMFKATEDRARDEVHLQTFDERLKAKQNDFERIYPLLRELILMTRQGPSGGDLRVVTRTPDGAPATLSYRGRVKIDLEEYREKMPHRLHLEQPAFQVDVEVERL